MPDRGSESLLGDSALNRTASIEGSRSLKRKRRRDNYRLACSTIIGAALRGDSKGSRLGGSGRRVGAQAFFSSAELREALRGHSREPELLPLPLPPPPRAK